MDKARTPEEQAIWDQVAIAMLSLCGARALKGRGIEGCAQLARQYADAFLAERRRSIAGDRGAA